MSEFTKKITINNAEYEIVIVPPILGDSFMFRVVGLTAFASLPNECLKDMSKFKDLIIKAIKERYGDLSDIHEWDGIIEAKELTYLVKNEKTNKDYPVNLNTLRPIEYTLKHEEHI